MVLATKTTLGSLALLASAAGLAAAKCSAPPPAPSATGIAAAVLPSNDVPSVDDPKVHWPNVTEYFPSQPATDSLVPLDSSQLDSSAKDAIQTTLGVNSTQYQLIGSATDPHNQITHVYAVQLVNGLPVVNAAANVNLDAAGNVISLGSTFGSSEKNVTTLTRRASSLNITEALVHFAQYINVNLTTSTLKVNSSADGQSGTINGAAQALSPVKFSLGYFQTPTEYVRVWDISYQLADHWWNGFVSVADGSLLGLGDWVSSFAKRAIPAASYNVVPVNQIDITSGRSLVVDPYDRVASPGGWHDAGNGSSPTLAGNNVYAQDNHEGSSLPSDMIAHSRPSSANYVFDYPVDLTQDPYQSVNAAVTNVFYLVNSMHDVYYLYGFTEPFGNFQNNNFGKGGAGGDFVIANVQDSRSTNNANFFTPPDGTSGILNIYLSTMATPRRDEALDNNIVVHETFHGVSNRLTGGSALANCLTTTTSMGLGEGWSDMAALVMSIKPTDTRATNYALGAWSFNRPNGIRTYPYSTSLTTNPTTYKLTGVYQEVHKIGEIWTSLLLEVYWNLVDQYGTSSDIKAYSSGKGNTIFFQLVIDGLKNQPCNPNFVNARNAILLADQTNNKGANQCLLWKGFAKRGLGYSATTSAVDAFDLPPSCSASPTIPGCFVDGPSRVLAAKSTVDPAMTVDKCNAFCSQNGNKYFGVENGNECYCGDSIVTGTGGDGGVSGVNAASSSQCNTPCAGNSAQTCGGAWRMSIAPVTTPNSGFTAGCYVDNSQRVLNYKASVDYGSMTLATCKSLCSQYKYYGVEYGGECYCGNSLATPGGAGGDGQGTFGTVVSSSQCSTPCPGGPSQTTCGGPWRVWVDSVSSTAPTTTTTATTPSATPTSATGCYVDNSNRVLSNQVSINYSSMTLATCKSLCSQYKYYGVEYGGECYCGNSLATPGGAGGDGQGTFGTVVSSSQCSTPCPGGPSQTTCGGPWRVWIDTVTPSITGCYVDNSQRVLNYKASVDYGSMTLATCKSLCSQYKYYGVEYGGECYCGNSLATPGGAGGDGQGTFGTVVSSSQCSTPCPGGPSQTTCGGPWRVWIDTVTPSITGCYVDNSQRVLNYKASVDYGSMTLATCKSLCSQYKYYGVEYGGECYCGNSLATPGGAGGDGQGTFGTVVSSSQCSTPCPGGPSQTTCGGPWRVWVDTVA